MEDKFQSDKDSENQSSENKKLYLVKENEVYKRERELEFSKEEIVTFKIPEERVYKQHDYDWYMTVALGKVDNVVKDRHLLTAEVIIGYRNAIREGFNHMLDPHLRNRYDYPRNRNTVQGIIKYTEGIFKKQAEQHKKMMEE